MRQIVGRTSFIFAVSTSGFIFAAGPVGNNIAPAPFHIGLNTLASGLTSPDDLIPVPGNPNQQLILDQAGKILVLDHGVVQSAPFMDLTSRLVPLTPGYDERGLLGLAFDPNYNTAGAPGFHTVYTYTSEPVNGPATFTVPIDPGTQMNCQNVIAAWNTDTNSRREILRIDKPQFNHNGGTIVFGPDGNLYLGTGDGGNANDVGNGHNPATGNAQDFSVALGKMLRIDVHGNNSGNGQYGIPASNPFVGQAGKLPEIYASGFRNPYRFSFDQATGKLIVADVGQNNIEEVDIVNNGGNYGWHLREGNHDFNSADGSVSANSTATPAGLIDPVAEYDHVNGGIAISGGFIYHGAAIPELVGKYVFGDFSTSFGAPNGRLFYTDLDNPSQIFELLIGTNGNPLGIFLKGIGQDGAGELYALGSKTLGPSGTTGVVLQLTSVPEPTFAMLTILTLCAVPRRKRIIR